VRVGIYGCDFGRVVRGIAIAVFCGGFWARLMRRGFTEQKWLRR
jgi:hypothetical protein